MHLLQILSSVVIFEHCLPESASALLVQCVLRRDLVLGEVWHNRGVLAADRVVQTL